MDVIMSFRETQINIAKLQKLQIQQSVVYPGHYFIQGWPIEVQLCLVSYTLIYII